MYNLATDSHLCFAIICLIFIDQGDGHWKEKDRENLRHDIELYRNLAEKIEHEIESFYKKYSDERHKDEATKGINLKYLRNEDNFQKDTVKLGKGTDHQNPLNNVTNSLSSDLIINEDNLIKVTLKNNQSDKNEVFNAPWPKFDDILLAMGKKYDWKNDRWIKLKRKLNKSDIKKSTNGGDNKSLEFHEKHKFSYKIVKLSKSKSRRNVVVAVTAVR